MKVLHERGYLIPAVNTDTDYQRCAKQLAASIQQWHPDAHVTIVTEDMLPHGNQGGYANDWQMFEIPPWHHSYPIEKE